jgi:pSer/pThr/pTyr-binding forkhead associated (FHA) protein
MFKLVIQDDEGKTTVVPLIRDEITIGRKEGNTIRLTERNVSRRHARILRNNGEVQIEDLGSYNGIRVNNARIAERVSLRVSDQVQIGDYKLYLKAEGVEQVDDARTMPIERVDTANTATDVMVAAAPPATQPMTIQTPAPGTLPPAAQLVGNPNRTLVAVADTDPQGRPVASPAQVAAVLSSPVGYGKLVVLSSNFAGKEFELSRPQMIIGRTDENDIVVNHRSISRNHAKLVREPDTGRYTISDLQSSNGVRVNGQDYGKVELRRGDVVDLGHVRLRFVEAGEDFVFSRDAVITDVPDSGSKRTLFIAVGLAAIVVVGVVVFLIMKSGDKPSGTKNGSNDVVVKQDAGDIIATAEDAGGTPATPEDSGGASVAPMKDTATLRLQCKEAADAKKWSDLIDCAQKLKDAGDPEGNRLYASGHEEEKAQRASEHLANAVRDGSIKKAKEHLDEIGKESVYRKDAEASYGKLRGEKVSDLTTRAKKVAKGDCGDWKKLFGQEATTTPKDILDEVKKDVPCKEVVVVKEACNAEELFSAGMDIFSKNGSGFGLQQFEASQRCQRSTNTAKFILAAACKSKNLSKAKSAWKGLAPAIRQQMESLCAANGFFKEMLEAP